MAFVLFLVPAFGVDLNFVAGFAFVFGFALDADLRDLAAAFARGVGGFPFPDCAFVVGFELELLLLVDFEDAEPEGFSVDFFRPLNDTEQR